MKIPKQIKVGGKIYKVELANALYMVIQDNPEIFESEVKENEQVHN